MYVYVYTCNKYSDICSVVSFVYRVNLWVCKKIENKNLPDNEYYHLNIFITRLW